MMCCVTGWPCCGRQAEAVAAARQDAQRVAADMEAELQRKLAHMEQQVQQVGVNSVLSETVDGC